DPCKGESSVQPPQPRPALEEVNDEAVPNGQWEEHHQNPYEQWEYVTRAAQAVTALVHRHDVIPRWSTANCYDLMQEVAVVDQLPWTIRDRLLYCFAGGHDQMVYRVVSDALHSACQDSGGRIDPGHTDPTSTSVSYKRLQLVGHTVLMWPREENPAEYMALPMDAGATALCEVRILGTEIVTDHCLKGYRTALESARNSFPLETYRFS
ncbi:hypothetical protein CYMTET_20599, partial [Cymbomonas tetramitiformis]